MAEKILIVDDNELVRRALGAQLRSVGYRVAFAADAIGAVAAARKEEPDLILLDLGLPGGNGVVVLERLRALPHLSGIPVIVLTGMDAEVRWRCLEAGAVAFLRKPVSRTELLLEIHRALEVGTHAGLALAV
jgi:CheY-like chemotaxis protein